LNQTLWRKIQHHPRPRERRLLHCSRLLHRHVSQPDLHGGGTINYDSKSEVFWEPGDSGSTGGSGKTQPFDMTRSGGSSSASGPTGSPMRTSTSLSQYLDVENDKDIYYHWARVAKFKRRIALETAKYLTFTFRQSFVHVRYFS
jgi:hypothetical protein